jgi:hypothetical protein
MSSSDKKGVGDSLAGARNRARRHDTTGAALREPGTDAAEGRVGHFVPEARRSRQGPRAIASDVRDAREPVASDGGAHVQTVDAEKSSAHLEQALDATIRREGRCRRHAPGHSGVRRPFDASGIRAQVHRSHARCPERDSSHRGEMGPSAGQPVAGRRPADAQDGQAKVGPDPRRKDRHCSRSCRRSRGRWLDWRC